MFHLRVSDACFSGTEHGEGVQMGKEAGGVLGLKRVGSHAHPTPFLCFPVMQRSEEAPGVQDAQGSRCVGELGSTKF